MKKHIPEINEEYFNNFGRYKEKDKISFIEFNEKLVKWYDETRPASGKPRIGLRSRFYDMYLKGQDFEFL